MITYPVDVLNTRWSAYDTVLEKIVAHNKEWPNRFGLEVTREPHLIPLLEVREDQPAYDTATHQLESSVVVDVPNNTHTHGWTVVARSQEDLDAESERDQARALYSALKSHSGTAGDRATRLENVVAYMLKNQYGAS